MKNCSEIQEQISLFIDKQLAEGEKAEFEQHMQQCKECREGLNQMIKVVDLCKQVPQEDLPDDFEIQLHQKLMDAKSELEQRDTLVIRLNKYIKIGSSIAAAVLIVFLARGFWDMDMGFAPSKEEAPGEMIGSSVLEEKWNKDMDIKGTSEPEGVDGKMAWDEGANNKYGFAPLPPGEGNAAVKQKGHNDQEEVTAGTAFSIAEAGPASKVPNQEDSNNRGGTEFGSTMKKDTGNGGATEKGGVRGTAQPEVSNGEAEEFTKQSPEGQTRETEGIWEGNTDVGMTICSEDPEKSRKRIRDMMDAYGAEDATVYVDFVTTTALEEPSPNAVMLSIKIPGDQYPAFINQLRSEFRQGGIQVEGMDIEGAYQRVDQLEQEIDDINFRMESMKAVGNATSPLPNLDELKDMKQEKQQEIEEIRESYEYIYIHISLEKK